MIIVILLAVLMAGSIESNIRESFSDPYWMGFEDREDEDYKWSDNIKNYQEEER